MKTQFNSESRATGPVHSAINEPTRELAERRSGSVEVLLLWHPVSNIVELRIHDMTTAESAGFRIPPDEAMRAFRHPYAYAARAESVPLSRTARPLDLLIHSNQSKGNDYA